MLKYSANLDKLASNNIFKQSLLMDVFHPSYFFNLNSFKHACLFDHCSYVWEVLSKISSYLKKYSLGSIETDVPQGTFLVEPSLISIGKGTVIEPGAYIKGPCIIGENCTIRHGAYIRGDFIAGNDCVIGHDTEVKNSIMMNKSNAAHFAYLGDTVLGNGVNLGAGTKCANLKLDHQPISILYEKKLIETGLRKFGAIIGDGSQLGCNSVSNPGSLLGQNVLCYPCINFGGFIASNQIVKAQNKILIKPR